MDALLNLLRYLSIWHWNAVDETRDYPWVKRILWPLALVAAGAAVGGWSYAAKTAFTLTAGALASFYLVHFVLTHKVLLAEAAAFLGLALKGETTGTVAKTTLEKVMPAMFVGIIAVSFMARWFPMHQAVLPLFMLVMAIGGLIAWSVYYKSEVLVWKQISFWALVLTLLEALMWGLRPSGKKITAFLGYFGLQPSESSPVYKDWWVTHHEVLMYLAVVIGAAALLLFFLKRTLKGREGVGRGGESAARKFEWRKALEPWAPWIMALIVLGISLFAVQQAKTVGMTPILFMGLVLAGIAAFLLAKLIGPKAVNSFSLWVFLALLVFTLGYGLNWAVFNPPQPRMETIMLQRY